MQWTEHRVAVLKELLRTSRSAGMIAQSLSREFKFKVSRCAVIGKAGRMGLPLPGKKGSHQHQNAVAHLDRHPQRGHPRARPAAKSTNSFSQTIPAPSPTQPPPPLYCSFAELSPQSCRWPYGQSHCTAFCGRPCAGRGPYCPEHMRQANVPPRPAKDRSR